MSWGGPRTPSVGKSHEVGVRVPCLKVKTRGAGSGGTGVGAFLEGS